MDSSITTLAISFTICALLLCNPHEAKDFARCGLRKESFVQLIHQGSTAGEGEWPWHTALYHRSPNGTFRVACGGTLLSQKHVLTAAHCVLDRGTTDVMNLSRLELRFGQLDQSDVTNGRRLVQIRDVTEVHKHPEYKRHRHDIAVLIMRLAVKITDNVVPICIDQRVQRDLKDLVGKRGQIVGYGSTETGPTSEVLRTASLPVVDYPQCSTDETLRPHLTSFVYCAGDRNGTSAGTGDSGGGMYFFEGNRWVLKGVVSFSGDDSGQMGRVDTSTYTVFVNVRRYLNWIRQVMEEEISRAKRISETECDRFRKLAKVQPDDSCEFRNSHLVLLTDYGGYCTGVLVNEKNVLTTCSCIQSGNRRAKIHTLTSVNIRATICHPKYDSRRYDLAVVKLDAPVRLSNNLIPGCLANNWTENVYDTIYQAGFETERSNSFENPANQPMRDVECNDLLTKWYSGASPGILCLNNTKQGRPTSGETGGYLLQSINHRTCTRTILGMMSNMNPRIGAGWESTTEVYSRIAYHLDWIEQTAWRTKTPPRPSTEAPGALDQWFAVSDPEDLMPFP